MGASFVLNIGKKKKMFYQLYLTVQWCTKKKKILSTRPSAGFLSFQASGYPASSVAGAAAFRIWVNISKEGEAPAASRVQQWQKKKKKKQLRAGKWQRPQCGGWSSRFITNGHFSNVFSSYEEQRAATHCVLPNPPSRMFASRKH